MKISDSRFRASVRTWSLFRKAWRVTLSFGLLSFIGVSTARAQTDNFNSGTDTGWTRYDPLAGLGAPATFSFPGGNTYRIQAAVSPNPGVLGPGRAGSLRTDQTYSDFAVSFDLVDWNNSQDQAFGMLARVSQPGLGTTDGYAFTYATDGSIQISRILNEAASTVGGAAATLNPANDYRFVFTGNSSSLSGAVFDLANLSTPVATASGTDATYASGFLGFIVFDNSSTGTGTPDANFDNYSASVVPEPSTLGLLFVGGLGLLGLAVRRQVSSRNSS